MQDFVHLHVHSHYSILDGQASIQKLVDKAIKDGMRGIAITDHGNMFGIKEFWNYVKKKNGARRDKVKQTSAAVAELQAVIDSGEATEEQKTELADGSRPWTTLHDWKHRSRMNDVITVVSFCPLSPL